MKSKSRARRPYDASGRQAQARETRDAIVDAALLRLRRVRPEELTYADIANDVGIAVRTVYRHFPAPQDLLAAALQAFLDTLGASALDSKGSDELSAILESIHARLSAEPGLYRLFFALPARTGVGMAATVKALCRDALAQIPLEHHDAVCAAVELMLGPYAWEIFHTHWAVSPARITRTLLASVQTLIDGFVAHPEMLDEGAERPPLFRNDARERRSLDSGSRASARSPHRHHKKERR